jgi:uncharacterized protein (DUF4415 family)
MNEDNMNRPSETNWEKVDALTDETIDTSDIPPLDESHFKRAVVRMPQNTISINITIDSDVLEWFKAQGDTWQQRVNAALRIYAEAHKDSQH